MVKLSGALLSTLAIVGCSSMQNMIKSNFAKKMAPIGVSAADIEAVDLQATAYYEEYQRTATHKIGVSNRIMQTRVAEQVTKITNIFCGCVKELGEKCQGNPAGLTEAHKDLWIRGNGAAQAISLIQRSQIDPLSCP